MFGFFLLTFAGFALGHKICYPRYGCFSDDPPFNGAFIQLPESPDYIAPTFSLYTRANKTKGHILTALRPSTIHTSDFDNKRPTIVIIHGYIESSEIFWIKPMREALLTREDANVIVTDWSKGARFPYHQAFGNTRLVGAITADLINVLINETDLDLARLHLVGFSMGAQISGFVGRNLRREGKALGRITGLDPAAPLYEYKHTDVRLDKSDADFVDIIHTDSHTILIKGFGVEQITGHLDFYPNNGRFQPNCRDIRKGPAMFVTCSHWRATMYFTESIQSVCPFYSYQCQSYEDFEKGFCNHTNGLPSMGYNASQFQHLVNQSATRYYLKTDGNKPFCVYHYQITLYTGSGYFTGVSANIKIVVTDKKGQQTQLPIEFRSLYSGSTEYFLSITKKNMLDLQNVKITHDALIDLWYLDKIVIRPLWKDTRYMGCYKRWLNAEQNSIQLKTDTLKC